MRFLVNFPDPSERAALVRILRAWMELSCASMDIVAAEAAEAPGAQSVVFWDLDGLETAVHGLASPGLRSVSLLPGPAAGHRQLRLPPDGLPLEARVDGAPVGGHAPVFPALVFRSSKSPGRFGIGLETVREVAKRYGGQAEFTVRNGEFRAAVFLPRPAADAGGTDRPAAPETS